MQLILEAVLTNFECRW